MKKVQFCLSLMLALVLAFGTVSPKRALAVTGTLHAETEETENGVAVKLVADSAMDFGGIWFSISYDKNVFTYSEITSPIGTASEGDDIYEINTGNKKDFQAGDAVVTITYTASNIEANKEYKFDITIKEAYDDDAENHVDRDTVISATYLKEEEPTEPSPSETEPEETSSEEETTEPSSSETQPSSSETQPSSSETQPSSSETQASSEAESSSDKETTEAVSTEAAETTEAVETTAADETTKDASTDGSTPDSGDDSALTVYLTTASTAALLLGALFVIRRKKAHAE